MTIDEVAEGIQKEKLRRKMKKAGLNVVDNMNKVILDEEKDPKLQKKLKQSVSRKNKKVSENKDGGMIGNLTSNFKGYY